MQPIWTRGAKLSTGDIGMNIFDAIASAFLNSVTWAGRASRSEFWYFYLVMWICYIPIYIFGREVGAAAILAFAAIFMLPSISVTVRRLHDTNRSGWWFWIVMIPLVGPLIYLGLMCWPGDAHRNDYGDDPLMRGW